MVFTSNLFLFAFLPAVLTITYVLPRAMRNGFLFLASVFFYVWGTGAVVGVVLLAIGGNYVAGRMIAASAPPRARSVLRLTVVADCLLLFYFKYLDFFCDQIAVVLGWAGVHWQRDFAVPLPIGISFFAFQAMTYPIEIYRGVVRPADRFVDVGTYLTLFPHVLAGPVVRYSDISEELRRRTVDVDDLFDGLLRFAVGLGKKVLIANQVGAVADRLFAVAPGELTPPMAWIAMLSYGLQIYFDFSGYSDMAIGMARVLGFHFPENFDRPYRAESVTDFWRRWHMTLSAWFRDFVYIPLGGNRHGTLQTLRNLVIVFFLCGLWHGAAWTFVIWGLYHGVLLVAERVAKTRFGWMPSGPSGTAATCLLVFLGWIWFRSPDVPAALDHFSALLGVGRAHDAFQYRTLAFFLDRRATFHLVLAAVLAWVPFERLRSLAVWEAPLGVALRGGAALGLIVWSAAVLSTAGFNPFIYFRF